MFGLPDLGFFRKKVADGNNSRDFRYTKGNCKHYGAKVVDIFALGATICFAIPLIIDIFNKDSGNGNGDMRNNNNNGKTRKR